MSRPMPTLCFAELVMVSTPTCAILTCHLASEVCRTTVVVGAVVDVAMRRRRSVQMTRLVYFARPSTFPAAETCSISSPSSCSRTPHSCSWLADNRKGGPSPILRGAQLDDLQGEGRRVLANLVASTRQERLHEWAVRWGSPGGGVGRARAAVSGGAGPGGASVGVPGVGRAGGTGAGGTGAIGGTGGATVVGAAAGCPGSRRQEPLSPERLREWAVCWGSSGGGAARAGTAGSGGASAGVPRVDHVGGTSTGGTSATRGTGGAGPVGASDVVPQGGGIGGADTRGAIGGIGVGGSSWQESLSPQQLRTWAVRWGSPGGGGASGAGSEGDVPTGARGSGGVTTQTQEYVLCHLLSLPPAAT
ncbi:unnamed protein product [Closterium sp. NIES-54]